MNMDVQIAERTQAAVTTDNIPALCQGTADAKIQTSTEKENSRNIRPEWSLT